MNDEDYQIAIQVFNGTKITHWDPVMAGGQPLWERLSRDLLASPCQLSARQQTNALFALYRLRGWGDHKLFASVLKTAGQSDAIEVRDQAAKFMAGLVRLSQDESHKNEPINGAELISDLRKVIARGVTCDAALRISTLLPEALEQPSSGT